MITIKKITKQKHPEKSNTKKQKLLNELEENKDCLLHIINNSDFLFCLMNKNFEALLFNKAFYDYCYNYYNLKIKTGSSCINQIINHENQKEKLIEKEDLLKQIIRSKKKYETEVKHYDKKLKKERTYKISLKYSFDKNKKIKNIYLYGEEVTEKYDFLDQIQTQSLKINTIIENSPIYLWSMNANREILLFNTNYANIIEKLYGEKPVIGKRLNKNKTINGTDFNQKLEYHYKKALNGSCENFKLNFIIDEKNMILDVNLFPIIKNNHVQEISGIAIDVTEQIKKQEQLESLIQENEILMKEMHHRIKNNLQVVSSMINLQIENEKNIQTKSILKDIQNRIYSMAMIHQTLYQNKDYTSVNIPVIISLLAQNILYSFNKTDVNIKTEIEDIILDINTAVPLSLIINEAITNVVKYAFPDNFKEQKNLLIQLKREKQNIKLIIADNGIGFPKERLPEISNTGFTIIRALSEQINADLVINSQSNKGTEIQVIVPQL